MGKPVRWLIFAIFAALGSVHHSFAQTGTIVGTVTDSTGGVIPNASITVTNADTNSERMDTTDDRGDYTVPLLPPGTYRVEIVSSGFRTEVAENIEVSADDRIRIDFKLQIGTAGERIAVTETTPLVQSDNSSLGDVIGVRRIEGLPIAGRQIESLAQLVPGAVSAAPGSVLSYRGGFNAAGARETANSNLLDGVDNNDPAINNFTLRPIVDAVQEFKVLTNSYSAEFGRGGGAQVIVTTKSGTNGYHVSLWEFFRNDKLDARDFFNKKDAGPKPPFHRNQFGGTVGGPITRNRTFFFLAYESVRRRQVFTSQQQVPTLAFLNGDFSSLGLPLVDPQRLAGPTFPFNRIPSTRINPV